jgi:rsbT co-antagonist protein RsbR
MSEDLKPSAAVQKLGVTGSGPMGAEEKARLLLDNLPQKVFAKDTDSLYVLCNKNYADGFGLEPDQIVGKSDFDLYPGELAEKHRADDLKVISGTTPVSIVERYTEQGAERASQIMKIPLKDGDGTVTGLLGIRWDVTDQVRAEDARTEAEKLVRRQAEEILAISTPVVEIWDGVVAMPLIGTLDSQRTQQIMEQLLQRIVDTRSSVALVDITGVPGVDTQTARHLIETVAAVRLLGAQVVLTGIRPMIAQTLVHLGVDLSDVMTRSSLAAGLRVALDLLNLQVIAKESGK